MTDIHPAPKPAIVRDKDYLSFIRGMSCVCGCGRPGEPHHVLHRRGYGEKNNVVPLARECHREGHQIGWATWQQKHQVYLRPLAELLWRVWVEAKARAG